jgi:hypothetical protein
LSDSALLEKEANPPAPPAQQPPISEVKPSVAHTPMKRQAEVKQRKPDPEVDSRPPKKEPIEVDPIEVDVYIMHAASADEEAAIALFKEVEVKVHVTDDTQATAFVDIVTMAHLRIGDKKWRKKAEEERLARLKGAKCFVCLVSDGAVAELRSAHAAESVLLVRPSTLKRTHTHTHTHARARARTHTRTHTHTQRALCMCVSALPRCYPPITKQRVEELSPTADGSLLSTDFTPIHCPTQSPSPLPFSGSWSRHLPAGGLWCRCC